MAIDVFESVQRTDRTRKMTNDLAENAGVNDVESV